MRLHFLLVGRESASEVVNFLRSLTNSFREIGDLAQSIVVDLLGKCTLVARGCELRLRVTCEILSTG